MAATFAAWDTPLVNLVTVKRTISKNLKQNIFQEIIFRPVEAVSENYVEDSNAFEVQVLRVKPSDGQVRDLTADVNSGSFNENGAKAPETAAYGVRMKFVYDQVEVIPQVSQDMFAADFVDATMKNITGKVGRNINASTCGEQLGAALSKEVPHLVTLEARATGEDFRDAIVSANSMLDDGNEDEDIDYYPGAENRAIIMRTQFNSALKKIGGIILNSNYGQEMIRTGKIDYNTEINEVLAYAGTIDGVRAYIANDIIWKTAEKYLGLVRGQLNGVLAMVVCGIGTGRGLAFNRDIKTVDAQEGQGIKLQPLFRWGVDCWDGYSVVPIVAHDFVSPITSATGYSCVAPGSRLYTIKYDGNGNSGGNAPSTLSNKKYGFEFQAAAKGDLVKSGFDFAGWNTEADGTGKAYKAEDYYKVDANMTLYAQWKEQA